MSKPLSIRPARIEDAAALLALYRPYIENTAISFETAVPSLADFGARIAKVLGAWQWLLAERDGVVLGYAYASQHRERAAYVYSVDVGIYLAPVAHRQGIGRALYERLFVDLAALGYCNAFAGVALPNAASVGLHESVGFTRVGIYQNTGWKLGRWHDVLWLQRPLRAIPLSPEGQ